MSSLYINGKEIPEYTLIPDDTKFKEIGYSGFPRAFRETVKKLLEGQSIDKTGKYYLNGEEAYIYQDPVLKDYFNNIGYSKTYYYVSTNNGDGVGVEERYTWEDAFEYSKEIQENWNPGTVYSDGDDKLVFMPMIDTSNVTDMSYCFQKCSNLTTIPLLDTSNVTDMWYCFHSCSSLTTIPLLNTSNVTDMHHCFSYCSSLTTIPLLNTSNVTDMGYCFYNCTSLTTIPELDTRNVTDMQKCFLSCASLTTIPKLDTRNVTNMNMCFRDCSSLHTILQLDTRNVTNMALCFSGCSSLTTIPLLNTSNVTDMHNCFSNCSSLTTIPELDTSNVTNMSYCFDGCDSLTTIPKLDTSNVTIMGDCFHNCTSLTTIPELDTRSVTNMAHCFDGCSNLKRIEGISFKSMAGEWVVGKAEITFIFAEYFDEYSPNTSCRYILIKDIGTQKACTYIDTCYARVWGIADDEVTDARQSLIDSLLTYSFNRRAAGYPDFTINLFGRVKVLLTEDEITQIQAKGYLLINI